ncbi:MAG: hypothetical protein ACD_63C00197G0002 [uncultured bacterium]|nr:MAG: hypothetical protein ACD_63C00197G0002 [uncultured bacterium]
MGKKIALKKEILAELGWREKIWLAIINTTIWLSGDRRAKELYTSKFGATPDNFTAIKLIAATIITMLGVANCFLANKIFLTPTRLLYGIGLCFFADLFDGPLARTLKAINKSLETKEWTPKPFFLSEILPIFKEAAFDAASDKIAMGVGIFAVWTLGYPIKPLMLLFFWSPIKIIAGFHGAWLEELKYKDLLKTIIGKGTKEFKKTLQSYLAEMIPPVEIGRIEIYIQLIGLLTAAAWILLKFDWIIKIGWLLGFLAIVPGHYSYRAHMERYFEKIHATYKNQFHVETSLAFTPRNGKLIPLLITYMLVGLALYVLKRPPNTKQ